MTGCLRKSGLHGPRHQSRLASEPGASDVWSHDALRWARPLGCLRAQPERRQRVGRTVILPRIALRARERALFRCPRALGIASFGWVLVPIVALMTFLPATRKHTRVELVLAVAGLAHALILLLILAGIHWRSTRPTAVALVLTLVASFSGIVSMIVSLVGVTNLLGAHRPALERAFRWSGSPGVSGVPLAIGLAVAIPWRSRSGWQATLVLSGLAAGVVAIGMAVWKYESDRTCQPPVRRRASRFLPDDDFILYAALARPR